MEKLSGLAEFKTDEWDDIRIKGGNELINIKLMINLPCKYAFSDKNPSEKIEENIKNYMNEIENFVEQLEIDFGFDDETIMDDSELSYPAQFYAFRGD